MTPALETRGLGKRYGRTWALQDCTVTIPSGHVTALVGPNGAGKTTLLHLATRFLPPTTGEVRTLGRVGFLAQGQPLYRSFTVEDTLKMGRHLNRIWDDEPARARLRDLGIPFDRPVGKLSGGQQAQVALALTLSRRPELLLLDEPLASLDPLARRDFLGVLMETVAEQGLSVVLSSHDVADLARVCDHLVILSASHVALAGELAQVLRSHKRLTGPRRDDGHIAGVERVIEARHAERQSTLLARVSGPILDPAWQVEDVSLESLVLAYLALRRSGAAAEPAPRRVEVLS
jgi:ABC-2 type transport system ATP-binding protein